MTKKKTKTNKERKINVRYSNYNIKSSSKPAHGFGYFSGVGVNDPMNSLYMPHETDKFHNLTHFVVPFELDPNNTDKIYVRFHQSDLDYIMYWLHRMENELCHKSVAYQQIFNAFLQPVNQFANSTHQPIGHLNNTLSIIAGLRINFLRNGEEPLFLKSQLPMLEHAFWMAYWYLVEYQFSSIGGPVLTKQDTGFRKKTGTANPELYPIHFIKYNKPLIHTSFIEDDQDVNEHVFTAETTTITL